MNSPGFDRFFNGATGHEPFDYQRRLAGGEDCQSQLINVPTGLGKTAAVVLAWLWNRTQIPNSKWPRRLVYCLPMRTLVEQTQDEVTVWLGRLALLAAPENSDAWLRVRKVLARLPAAVQSQIAEFRAAGAFAEEFRSSQCEFVWLFEHSPVILMGGEEPDRDWDIWPEEPAILIGTQDMLLSRALNRGYAAGRARWPKDFALLNNDCLWVFDEVQLLGSGFTTSLQLQAWREQLRLRPFSGGFFKPTEGAIAGPVFSWWMSATLDGDWLETAVDFRVKGRTLVAACKKETKRFWDEDPKQNTDSAHRLNRLLFETNKQMEEQAKDKIKGVEDEQSYCRRVADAVAKELANLTNGCCLVILNTVRRASLVAEDLKGNQPFLIHSRFRPRERKGWTEKLKNPPRVIVATQVVEAGVDLSANLLFTELCPWPSLIQRLGRAARRPSETANVYWFDVRKAPAPYSLTDLETAAGQIPELKRDASIRSIKSHADRLAQKDQAHLRHRLLPYEPRFVPRDKDLFDLFDTTPDLTGADVDVSRFIRDGEEHDVRIFWRQPTDWHNPDRPPKSVRSGVDELCPVPVFGERGFREFVGKKSTGRVWRWDYSEGWTRLLLGEQDRIYPGQVFLLEASCGGYSKDVGWTGNPDDCPWKHDAELLGPWPKELSTARPEQEEADESDESDALSATGTSGQWRDILTHTREVCDELDSLLGNRGIGSSVPNNIQRVLRIASRLHDWGKAHVAFQAKIDPKAARSAIGRKHYPVAKAPNDCWRRNHLKSQPAATPDNERDRRRPRFRHELASAMAVLNFLGRIKPTHPALAWPNDAEVRKEFGVGNSIEITPAPVESNALAEDLASLSLTDFDLLLYLIAAHHGKVRMTLRSAPDDTRDDLPDPCPEDQRQARGVREGDRLPVVIVPGSDFKNTAANFTAPEVELHLDPMELGLSERCGRSWRERTQILLETHGPFRLAWYCLASVENGLFRNLG